MKNEEFLKLVDVLIKNKTKLLTAHRLGKQGRKQLLIDIAPYTIKKALKIIEKLRIFHYTTPDIKK